MAQRIDEALAEFAYSQPLPIRFYVKGARNAASKIKAAAHATFEGELLGKADALVAALEAYAEELERY